MKTNDQGLPVATGTKKYAAIALIEFSGIVIGVRAADAMVKRAPISVLRIGTVTKGKFLVLIAGDVASVEEAYVEGLSVGEGTVVDSVILPDVHLQVHNAVLGQRLPCAKEGIAVCETRNVASIVRFADAAIKGAHVDIVEMRLADALGGKGFVLLTGSVENLEVAIRIAEQSFASSEQLIGVTIIPSLHRDIAKKFNKTTRFARSIPTWDEDEVETGKA